MSNAVATALYATLNNDIRYEPIDLVSGITLLEAGTMDPIATDSNSAYFKSDVNLFRLWDGSDWNDTMIDEVVDPSRLSIVEIGGIGTGNPMTVDTKSEVVDYFDENEFYRLNYYVYYDEDANEVRRAFDVPVYSGVAPRNAKYPFVTIMPIVDVPILYQGNDPSSSQTHWDLKIWDTSMFGVGEIYDWIVKILDTQISVDGITDPTTSLRGRGMPLMAEDNRPNEILYSRVIECEVVF